MSELWGRQLALQAPPPGSAAALEPLSFAGAPSLAARSQQLGREAVRPLGGLAAPAGQLRGKPVTSACPVQAAKRAHQAAQRKRDMQEQEEKAAAQQAEEEARKRRRVPGITGPEDAGVSEDRLQLLSHPD